MRSSVSYFLSVKQDMTEKNNNFFRCFFYIVFIAPQTNCLRKINACAKSTLKACRIIAYGLAHRSKRDTIPYHLHAEGVPETMVLSNGSRAPAERKIVGESITYGQAHRL